MPFSKTDRTDASIAVKTNNASSKSFHDRKKQTNALLADSRYGIFAVWLLLTSVNLIYHPLIPLDETRYAAVAWEMWVRHDFLVPHLNGVPYHHKPPLLFWLYDLGWSLFGVSERWLLLVSPLCGLASLYWVGHLAGLLWPGNPTTARTAPWLLLGSLIWVAFMNGAMFDMLLGLCVLLAMIGLIRASSATCWRHWALFSLGCGLGLLAKGPVVFLYILPPFLLGGFWSEQARTYTLRWYLRGSLATLGGIAIALCWLIPAIRKVGDAYGLSLLWHQTVDRMINSFAHQRPFWWYLMLSPAILFPWVFWPRLWRHLFDRSRSKDSAYRFCLIWFVSGFVAFSLISGKQIHYLLPLMPALALLLSRILDQYDMVFKPSDALPYLFICLFGLSLLLLPKVSGIKLFQWLQTRQFWWPWMILSIGLGGIGFAHKTRRTAPHHYSIAIVLVMAGSLAGFFSSPNNGYDLKPSIRQLDVYLKSNEPLAWAGEYDGQFEFLMRLKAPLMVINTSDLWRWLDHNPDGHVILISDYPLTDTPRIKIDFVQPYREQWLIILSGSSYRPN